MTAEEKLAYIGGAGFKIRAIERLGIPEVWMSDGPAGDRGARHSTCYASGTALAASWDPEMAQRVGASIGDDARSRNIHIMLAPGVNISRSPVGGRNAEYFGEDPLLAGKMAVGYIRGLKSRHVMGCIKHFAANSQETGRHILSSDVDERTLREIYLPAFRMAVQEGQVDTVMTAFNKLNGIYCSHNSWLNEQVLRSEWGFTGIVMSDWGSVHDTAGAALGGCDLEMPGGTYMSPAKLTKLIDKGTVPMAIIDTKVRRILTAVIAAGYLDRPQLDSSLPKPSPSSTATALESARAAMVLVRNEKNLLPVTPTNIHSILVVGPNAHPPVMTCKGSVAVSPFVSTSIRDALKTQFPNAKITCHPGLQSPDGKSFIGLESLAESAKSADLVVACLGYNQVSDNNSVGKAFDLRKSAAEERAYVATGLFEGESHDRTFTLHPAQRETVRAVSAVNQRLVTVVQCGAGVDPAGWADASPAILLAWYPGQAVGTAVAEVISGALNPSGKTPVTFGKRLQDYASTPYLNLAVNDGSTFAEQLVEGYQGPANIDPQRKDRCRYEEGIRIGYRGFDIDKIEPWIPFGFGLSYTTFAFSALKVEEAVPGKVVVSFTVRNTGSRNGAEVGQVYITPAPAPFPRPPKELKGFSKVQLAPGEAKEVKITLPQDAFDYWNPESKEWTTEPGTYGILVGSSSRDIHLNGNIKRSAKGAVTEIKGKE